MSKRSKGDDGFFLRGDIWWIRTDPVTGKQESTKAKTRAQRSAWYEVRYRQSLDPEYQPETGEDTSLNGWAVRFIEHKRGLRAAATAKFYTDKLGHIVRLLGADTPIGSALRPKTMGEYALARRAEGTRNTTIRKEIGSARTLARFAARQGGYHGKPELLMPAELGDDYEPGERFLTPGELVSLMSSLRPDRAAHVALMVAFGSRYAEAFRVQPADVDTGTWLVHVRGTKTKRARATVPIAEPFRPLLLAALPYLPLGRWLNSNMVRDLAAACKRAGVTRVTANDLRRTHGTWLSELGIDDEHIGKVLRHADGRMARRVYGKLGPEQLGKLLAGKIAATKVQQLTVSGETVSADCPTNPDDSTVDDKRIENPRVGGSIPSRDTAKTEGFQCVTAGAACHGVTPNDAKARFVRNESATVDGQASGGWFGPSEPPEVAGDFEWLRGEL